ncbi:class I SAM-dependent methyltransferase [Spongiactinospora sp. 9N601]|uniref:class I SAM-dependent methyltransferase n=1 Tax=Spongiactinospora sp. 9N601 TaxID=3375149 RepID=UPI00378AD17F
MNRQLENLEKVYLPPAEGQPSLFQIWEQGGARDDSVTPSTYSAEYRAWMTGTLTAALDRAPGGGLLSLGCGNAAVEAEIARRGYRVLGVDAMAEAVLLAKAKGVEAVCADIGRWSPDAHWPVIYMDGVLGHLYEPGAGLCPVLSRIRSWRTLPGGGGATLVASNDAPNDGAPAQPAPGVPGFHWLSGEYMRDQALAAGYDDVALEQVVYRRPRSGDRVRSIIIARAHA